MAELLIAPCSYKAAKYAVMSWHYSRLMPVGKILKYGVWENNHYIGCIIFSRGNNGKTGSFLGLNIYQTCELARVALDKHTHEVSRMMSITLKLLKRQNPNLQLIVTYAEPKEGHIGKIYQALNWVYLGVSITNKLFYYKGKWCNDRSFNGKTFGKNTQKHLIDKDKMPMQITLPKFKYAYGANKEIKEQLNKLRQPYPRGLASIEAMRQTSSL